MTSQLHTWEGLSVKTEELFVALVEQECWTDDPSNLSCPVILGSSCYAELDSASLQWGQYS